VVSLGIALVCALLAAALVRLVVAQDRGVRHASQEGMARQQAEIALSFCENQLTRPSDQRVAALVNLETQVPVPASDAAWRQPAAWGAADPARIVVPADIAHSGAAGLGPARSPECRVDPISYSGTDFAFRITARGFSPGYRENAAGAAMAGTVVWLQSFVVAD
jgi:Tfp pilus assembly protein PilX